MTAQPEDLVVCLENSGYEAALERRKLDALLPDAEAETRGLLRVIDESGEDYLYPKDLFVAVKLPRLAQKALATA